MRYIVHGTRNVIISVEVEAGSADEAVQIASTNSLRYDKWDSDTIWHGAQETY